jgi:MFS family permease
MNFKQTVKLSHFEGALFALMIASTESFLNYYAVKQNISAFQIAILATLPLLCGAMAQISIPKLISEKNLGHSIVWTMLIQVIGVLGILHTVYQQFSYSHLLFFACIYFIGGQSSTPLWIDWASRIIPRRHFRKYMANRSEFTWYLILFFYVSLALLGQYTSWFKTITIFIIGAVARIISCTVQYFIIRRPIPVRPLSPHSQNENTEIKLRIEPNTKKLIFVFIYLTAFFRMAVVMSGPFFYPYMLNELKLSMTSFVILTSMPFLGRAIFFSRWGRAGTHYSAFIGVMIAALYISFIPIIWTLTSNYYYLLGLEIISGIAWGGLELNQVLMIQNFVHHKSRIYLGGHMALSNFLSVIGAIIGSYFISKNYSFYMVFRLSAFFRLAVALCLVLFARRILPFEFKVIAFKNYCKSVFSCH